MLKKESKEDQAIEVLKQIGIPKNDTKILFYLFNNGEVFSRDIEVGANLRQPEVSNSVKQLLNKNLIKSTTIKKTKGKGRPLFKYSLSKSNDEIIKIINDMFTTRIHQLESDMTKFNTIFGQTSSQ